MADMKHMANKQMERHMNKAMGTESPMEETAEAMPTDQATCPACGNIFDPAAQKAAAQPDPMAAPAAPEEEDWAS